MTELQHLVNEAAARDWVGESADRLMAAIERQIVELVPAKIKVALGPDEAYQRARILAWERCRSLAENPPPKGIGWGYLANHVRWRLADAVRAEWRRHQQHPAF